MRHGPRLLLVAVLVCLGSTQAVPPSSAAQSVVVPPTIDPTGVTDVTEQVQAFLDSVPDGSTAEFAQGATYRIEGTILVAGRRSLTIDGNGATFFADTDGASKEPAAQHLANRWPRRRVHFLVDGGSGIELHDIVVRGPHSGGGTDESAYVEQLEGQHGVEFRNVDGGKLHHCDISFVYGDFVSVANKARNVRVTDCRMSRNGRQGISITEAANVVIERNVMSHIRRAAVDVEPAAAHWAVADVVIRDNDIGPMRLMALASKGRGGLVRDITFENNRMAGSPLKIYAGAADGARRANYRIIGNRSDVPFGSPLAAMRFLRIDGVVVRGNTQQLNPDREAVAVATIESCVVTVADNSFPGAKTVHKTDGYACGGPAGTGATPDVRPPHPGPPAAAAEPRGSATPLTAAASEPASVARGATPENGASSDTAAADGSMASDPVGAAAAGIDRRDVGARPVSGPATSSVPVWWPALAAMLLASVGVGLARTVRTRGRTVSR